MKHRPRLKTNRFLPKYVTAFVDRHGKTRLRFRRKGSPDYYFKAPMGTEDFREEYHACLNPSAPAPVVEPSHYAPGTIGDLVTRYYSPATRLGPTPVTQGKVRAVIESFRKGRDDRPVAAVGFQHIDAIVARRMEKTMVATRSGERPFGGVHAARKLRKELIRLFDFAVKLGMIDVNPARQSEQVRQPAAGRSKGFHSWTEDEIGAYRAHWHLGTRERLAMELLLWTDQRRCDVVRMGKAQIQKGRIPVTQQKTGAELWIPVAPQLLEAIVAMPPADTSPFCFLITKRGKPFTKESFGNWFKRACVEAGLPHCTAHGLRKATIRRMAELEMANEPMKALSGQTRDETLRIYTAAASQVKLADAAIKALSEWERLTSTEGLDVHTLSNAQKG